MQKGDPARARILVNEIRMLDPGVNGIGLVCSLAQDIVRRDQLQEHLAQFDLI
jgi:hypothetical protein